MLKLKKKPIVEYTLILCEVDDAVVGGNIEEYYNTLDENLLELQGEPTRFTIKPLKYRELLRVLGKYNIKVSETDQNQPEIDFSAIADMYDLFYEIGRQSLVDVSGFDGGKDELPDEVYILLGQDVFSRAMTDQADIAQLFRGRK